MLARRRMFPLVPHPQYVDIDGCAVVPRGNVGFDAIVTRQRRLRAGASGETASDAGGRADKLVAGEFCFLNERRVLPFPIDWRLTSVEPVSHLWRFHLHYHEFLLDLLPTPSDEPQTGLTQPRSTQPASNLANRLWAIVDDWIATNPVGRPGALADAWHPFCLSKRIAVWLMVWHAIEPPDEMRDRFAASLEGQIRFLEHHLEWDLRGNHLLENLRTLAMAGAFLEGVVAEQRLATAEHLLRLQLAEQILPWGEHFERSPMYHAQMLGAVLDVRDAVAETRPDFAAVCRDDAQRMGTFLRAVTHPDGEVALLSDTALGETPRIDVLLAEVEGAARPPASLSADPSTGPFTMSTTGTSDGATAQVVGDSWTWRNGSDYLLFDAGPLGADELPAHAHCDLLTLEASVGGRRVFVDSGVYDYADGEMRRHCRSTAAHNVLQIDGVEQCDMWSRFRMGYRGHPSSLEHGREGEFHWCRATHDAYRRIGVPRVGRWLACRAGGPWFCVDWATGKGRHEFVDRLHLAPDASIVSESPHAVGIKMGERSLEIRSLTTDAEITIERGWYCPDFGVRQQIRVLTLTTSSALPACLGWMVQEAGQDDRASLSTRPDGGVELRTENEEAAFVLQPTGP